jgi:putative glycosyltransferase
VTHLEVSLVDQNRMAIREARPHLSVVTSLYRSEPTVPEFLARICAAAAAITDDYEVILVNDGSPDRVRDVVLSLLPSYPNVSFIDLSRNFGQLAAIHAGLSFARGGYVFVLDSDLEEPPELLEKFYNYIRERKNVDVVYGIHRGRLDPPMRAITSKAFYWFFERMTGFTDLKDMLLLRIMTRRFVDAYLSFGDYHLLVAGLSHLAGFDKETIVVEKTYKGSSGYSFRKRMVMASDAILSFSTRPLYWLFFGSLGLSFVLAIMAAALVLRRFLLPDYQAGWASLIVSVWLVGAIMINCMAIIGLYIAKVFEQVKQRPRFVVRQVHTSEGKH